MDARVSANEKELISQIQEIKPLIKAAAAKTEKQRRLSGKVADALHKLGCFHIYRPKELGGLGFDPVSAFRVIEYLSTIDSAAGWNVAISNTMEPFGAWFSKDVVEEIHGSFDTIMAGAFNPPRKAVPVDGGYKLSGQTSFNSNCHAATWSVSLANIYDDDEMRLNEDGVPITLLALFPMKDAEIVDNWNTLGMRGTGSHDLKVDNIFVPENKAVPLVPMVSPGSDYYKGPLHRMSVWPSTATNAVPALGVAQAAIDQFVEMANVKTPAYTKKTLRDSSVIQSRLAHAEAKLGGAREFLHATYNKAWQTAVDGNILNMQQRADCQQASTFAAVASAEVVDLIHSLVGASAIRNEQPFQRYFRDIHTITQHGFFCESRFEAVGQIRLGLDPDWPFFYI